MATDRNYYVICDDNCKFPAMTKEEILSAIEQAVSTGTISDIDAGFISKIKEMNANKNLQFWVGTTAQYNAIPEKAENTLYILIDDNSINVEAINEEFNELRSALDEAYRRIAQNESDTNTNTRAISDIESGNKAVGLARNVYYTDFTNAEWVGPINVKDITGLVDNATYQFMNETIINYAPIITVFSGLGYGRLIGLQIPYSNSTKWYFQNINLTIRISNMQQVTADLDKFESDGTSSTESNVAITVYYRRLR